MRRNPVVLAAGLLLLIGACDGDPPVRRSGGERALHSVRCSELDQFIERTRRGHVPVRSPDLALIPHEPNYVGTPHDAVHTGPYDFLAEVPLVFFGPGHIPATGEVRDPVTMADVAPTIARMIGFDGFDALDGSANGKIPSSKTPPRLVVTLVWDGGGWNSLQQHPDAWPFLKSLIAKGVSFTNATVGSTPSVTPPIHTTLGTGAFPKHHGIPHVKMTTANNDYIDPFEDNSPRYIKTASLADIYDRALENEPEIGVVATVNWHLGMIGHGAEARGGDRDVAVLLNSSGYTYGDDSIYDIPSELSDPALLQERAGALDATDGTSDGEWRGHDLSDPSVLYATPASVEFQQTILERTIATRGFGADRTPDLLFSNFKSIDDSGHHWGMTSDETGATIEATDAALGRLVDVLDREVGKKEWVVIVTADHGMALYPEQSGGWAIRGNDLQADLNKAFDVEGSPIIERVNSAGIYFNEAQREHIDGRAIGEWLLQYTAQDNLYEIDEIPDYYLEKADEPLFDAVLEGRKVVARSCTR